MSKLIDRFMSQEGQTLTEYGLIIFLVSVALVAAVMALAGGISGIFTAAVAAL